MRRVGGSTSIHGGRPTLNNTRPMVQATAPMIDSPSTPSPIQMSTGPATSSPVPTAKNNIPVVPDPASRTALTARRPSSTTTDPTTTRIGDRAEMANQTRASPATNATAPARRPSLGLAPTAALTGSLSSNRPMAPVSAPPSANRIGRARPRWPVAARKAKPPATSNTKPAATQSNGRCRHQLRMSRSRRSTALASPVAPGGVAPGASLPPAASTAGSSNPSLPMSSPDVSRRIVAGGTEPAPPILGHRWLVGGACRVFARSEPTTAPPSRGR